MSDGPNEAVRLVYFQGGTLRMFLIFCSAIVPDFIHVWSMTPAIAAQFGVDFLSFSAWCTEGLIAIVQEWGRIFVSMSPALVS